MLSIFRTMQGSPWKPSPVWTLVPGRHKSPSHWHLLPVLQGDNFASRFHRKGPAAPSRTGHGSHSLRWRRRHRSRPAARAHGAAASGGARGRARGRRRGEHGRDSGGQRRLHRVWEKRSPRGANDRGPPPPPAIMERGGGEVWEWGMRGRSAAHPGPSPGQPRK